MLATRWGSLRFKMFEVTDPEEVESLEQQHLLWRWYYAMVVDGFMNDFEEWLEVKHFQIMDEYRSYEVETKPGVYYLGLSSWCWNNHQDACEAFMIEQGIE